METGAPLMIKAHLEWKRATVTDADIGGWVDEPSWYWLQRCDRCGKHSFRLYDVHLAKYLGEEPNDDDGGFVFYWVCATCLIKVISVWADNQ